MIKVNGSIEHTTRTPSLCGTVAKLFLFAVVVSSANQLFAVDIYPGTNIQSVVNANAAGTTYVLKNGVHRLQTISPKDGDTYQGEPGTVLSGASLLTSFSQQGAYWVISGQTQQGDSSTSITCQPGWAGCQYPEQLFVDDVLLQHVTSLSAVTSGKWYFDYTAHVIYLASDPTGHKVETSVTPHAFVNTARNVTVRGLIIEKFATPAQDGAISLGTGWTIINNEIRLNHGSAIRIGTSMQVLSNYIHHNGQMGLGCSDSYVTVAGNEIAYNNAAHFDFQGSYGEAGGVKFSQTTGLTVTSNYVHDNDGPGLWMDGSNYGWVIQGNRTANNSGVGILDEISYDGKIRYNVVENEGHLTDPTHTSLWYRAGIQVATSPNAEIYGNTVVNSSNGIGAISNNRGTGPMGEYKVVNLNVHDNTVVQNGGASGGMVSDGGYYNQAYTSWNNIWSHNTYSLSNGSTYTWLNGTNYGDLTPSQWVAAGQDTTGVWLSSGAPVPSTQFAAGARVALTTTIAVHSLPTISSTATMLATLVAGATGTVTKVRGPVYSDGDIWWQVAWDGNVTGWVSASNLIAATANSGGTDTTPPSIGISSPTNNATVSGAVTVTTVASDNVGVTKVELYVDNVLTATAASAPWTLTWNTATVVAGSHVLLAKAYDAVGNTGGATITVNVGAPLDTTPPTIGIGYPYNNSTVSGVVTVTDVVSDNVGIVRVELYVDNLLTATTASAPWSLTWNTAAAAAGNHVLLAKAYDAAGNTGGAAITVNVVAPVDIIAPTIGISYPYNNSTVSGVVTVTNVVSDNVGVVRAELYVDNVLTAATVSAPWSLTWNTATVTAGNHVLFTKAYDAAGNTGGAAITVTIAATVDKIAPTIGISHPYNNSWVSGTVSVTNVVSDNVGVVKVELYVDNVLTAATPYSPWAFAWDTAKLTPGNHTLLTRAYDAAGNSGSAVIKVHK